MRKAELESELVGVRQEKALAESRVRKLESELRRALRAESYSVKLVYDALDPEATVTRDGFRSIDLAVHWARGEQVANGKAQTVLYTAHRGWLVDEGGDPLNPFRLMFVNERGGVS